MPPARQVAAPNELDLYEPVLRLFRRYPYAFSEFPYFKKRVDLVFTSHSLRSVCAVEMKIDAWQKALKQAAVNQLFANLSYVAMPLNTFRRLADWLDVFRRHRVGIIVVEKK